MSLNLHSPFDTFPVVAMIGVVLMCATSAAAAVLSQCSTVSATLATVDTSVNTSCTSIAFSNVVVQGNMTLNISIAGIAMANPMATNINVSISSMTLQSGAILAIDSSGYAATGGIVPSVSIMIQSLVGSESCLVLIGSFPVRGIHPRQQCADDVIKRDGSDASDP